MPLLKDILNKISLQSVAGDTGVDVAAITFDSRAVRPGSLFVALRGQQTDGHAYLAQAVAQGAVAILCETLPDALAAGVAYAQTPDTAVALGTVAANFYGHPSARLKLVGVTGTNGKTTVVTLLYQLFRRLGYRTGLLSTVQNWVNDTPTPTTHTTPDALTTNALLAEMVRQGCTHAFMEVSSHAVVLHRIAGLQFAGGVFTNLTHDHLDFHGTFDNYLAAKKKFFDDLPAAAFALSNADDKRGLVMMQNTAARKNSYSLQMLATFKGKLVADSLHGLQMEVAGKEVWFKLIGRFNAYNLLATYATATLLDENPDEVLVQLSDLTAAPGRFEQVVSPSQVVGIVDYAHTPDALDNVLTTIQELRAGDQRVITVVGCGGNRDATKRPLMAGIACRLSDLVILTSDNPRHEDPLAILAEMERGVSPTQRRKVRTVPDRREAILLAISLAQPHDIVLVAGKGHENYQEIKGVKYPFDDKEELKAGFGGSQRAYVDRQSIK